jgi:hypothetical protein
MAADSDSVKCLMVECGKALADDDGYRIIHPRSGGGSICNACFEKEMTDEMRERWSCTVCYTHTLNQQLAHLQKHIVCMTCCFFHDQYFPEENVPNKMINLFNDHRLNSYSYWRSGYVHIDKIKAFDRAVDIMIKNFANLTRIEIDPKRNAIFKRLNFITRKEKEEDQSYLKMCVPINRMHDDEINNVFDALDLNDEDFLKIYHRNSIQAERRVERIDSMIKIVKTVIDVFDGEE